MGSAPDLPAKSSRTSSRTNRATRGSTIPASMSSIAARSSSEGWTNRGDGHVDIVKALLVNCGHNDTPVHSTASRTTERSPSTGTRSTGRARISVRARSRPASSTSPIDGGIVGTMSTSLSGPSPPTPRSRRPRGLLRGVVQTRHRWGPRPRLWSPIWWCRARCPRSEPPGSWPRHCEVLRGGSQPSRSLGSSRDR